MIGLEFEWLNERGHSVESSGPYFTQKELPLKDVKEFYAEGGRIAIHVNEYLGTVDDYDFNAPLQIVVCPDAKTFAETLITT